MEAEKSLIDLFMVIGKYNQNHVMVFFHLIIENLNNDMNLFNK